ncbi:MAG: FAD-binding oxidoreductase [Patescibacteria group bacterium]
MKYMSNTPHSGDRVVVIGGGATGALCSVVLAEAGFQVIALEKKAIGNGSSSRSAACIRAQFGVRETALGMAYSEYFFDHFHEYMHTPPDQQCWMIRHNGYLFLYEDPALYEAGSAKRKEVEAAWAQAQAHATMHREVDLPVEVLTPAEVYARWPHLDSSRLIGATWCPSDGFLNHDQIYQLGFRRAQELGAVLKQNTEVISARVATDRIVALNTTHGEVECDWVVNAAGAWSPRVSRSLGGMDLRISPLKRYLWFLSTRNPEVVAPNKWLDLPMTIYGMGGGRGVYSRPETKEQLLLGWAHETPPEPNFVDADQDFVEPTFADIPMGNHAVELMSQVADFSPVLAECGAVTSITCGYYETTPDHNPMIGFDDGMVNLVHAAGFSGHGLMHAPITALLVREIMQGAGAEATVSLPAPFERYSMSLQTFAPDRPIDLGKKEGMVI